MLVTATRKNKYHSVWLYKMRNLCTSVLPNTYAWEQQDGSKTKIHRKKVRINVERSTVGTKKVSSP